MTDRRDWFYAVASSGDGQHHCAVVRGLESARKEICRQLWFGPYEEAKADPMIAHILKEFDDVEDYWSDGGAVFECKLEQAWLRVNRVDEVVL